MRPSSTSRTLNLSQTSPKSIPRQNNTRIWTQTTNRKPQKSMPARTRPIQRFAQAVAQCSPEVCMPVCVCPCARVPMFPCIPLPQRLTTFQRHLFTANASWQTTIRSTRTSVQRSSSLSRTAISYVAPTRAVWSIEFADFTPTRTQAAAKRLKS